MESGTLSSQPPAELMRGLASLHATGCLRLEHQDSSATVHFRDGMVYTASAPAARARLGDRLVGAGHISEEQLSDTLAEQAALPQPRRIGELLIERGLIDRETMRAYVREQIADSVTATLRWSDGAWSFSEGVEVAEDAPLDMSVENLLMEGARRLEEWGTIESQLGSLDTVVDFAPGGSAAELSLTPDEWSMLTRIDGASTIAEIAEAAGYSQFAAARIIYGLFTAGVVTVVADVGAVADPGAVEDAGVVEDGTGTPSGGETPAGDGVQVPTVPWDAGARDPAAPDGEPDPAPSGAPDHAQPAGPAEQDVDRNELLKEFAALDEPGAEPRTSTPQGRPEPPVRKPVAPPEPDTHDRRERRGLFRRRRD